MYLRLSELNQNGPHRCFSRTVTAPRGPRTVTTTSYGALRGGAAASRSIAPKTTSEAPLKLEVMAMRSVDRDATSVSAAAGWPASRRRRLASLLTARFP